MKLKVKFEYQCETEIKPENIETVEKNINNQEFINKIEHKINSVFLSYDGRTEAGGITTFQKRLEKWK